MRVAIDTNVLAYIAGVVMAEADRGKAELAREQVAVIRRSADAVLPTQVMGELYHLLTRRGEDRSRARETVRSLAKHTSSFMLLPQRSSRPWISPAKTVCNSGTRSSLPPQTRPDARCC